LPASGIGEEFNGGLFAFIDVDRLSLGICVAKDIRVLPGSIRNVFPCENSMVAARDSLDFELPDASVTAFL
jgi:hypothetical protein